MGPRGVVAVLSMLFTMDLLHEALEGMTITLLQQGMPMLLENHL